MTDENKQERPDEPIVAPQLLITDLRRNGMFLPFGMGEALRAGVMGSTNFENKDLEEMLALVRDANPGDLESAADTLWKAGGDIRQIGEDLKAHIDKVDWEGEFGDSFREWGRNLSKNTLVLADYTERASTQLKAAGVGLAAVKGGMPDEDPAVLAAPRLEDIPPEERVETNEKYKLAKKKEEDRQEAINQMNRLASYYKVSHENMQAAEEPTFGPMPNVGVPWVPVDDSPSEESRRSSRASTETQGTTETLPQVEERRGAVRDTRPDGMPNVPNTPIAHDREVLPEREVQTDLNTVAPPAAPPADSGPRTQLPAVNGTSPAPNPVAPMPSPSYNNAGNNRLGRAPRAMNNPVPGPRDGAGRVGGATNVPGSGGAARPVTGGPGGTPAGRAPHAAAPPMGRGNNGIIGGTPHQGGTAANNPRIPRGTVVGAENGTAARPPVGSTGGTGAIGAGPGNASSGRRLASTPGGVVGAPRSGPAMGAAPRPFTPGGTGLARGGATGGSQAGAVPRTGTGNSRDSSREETREESRRPGYLAEDEETWTTGRNGVVPPVVD